MASKREVKESPMEQGTDESIIYTLTTTPWGSSPGAITPKVYDITDSAYTDVTTTNMPTGSASASGDVITLPALTALTADHTYRIEVKFTCGGSTFEAYATVNAKR